MTEILVFRMGYSDPRLNQGAHLLIIGKQFWTGEVMGFIETLSNVFNGQSGGFKLNDLFAMVKRDQLSDFLPWIAYDEETWLYYLADNTYGFMWECSPLFFSSMSTVSVTEGLVSMLLPEST